MNNVTARVDARGGRTSYQYDALSQVVEADYPKEKIEQIRDTYYTPPLNSLYPNGADGSGNTDPAPVVPDLSANLSVSSGADHNVAKAPNVYLQSTAGHGNASGKSNGGGSGNGKGHAYGKNKRIGSITVLAGDSGDTGLPTDYVPD